MSEHTIDELLREAHVADNTLAGRAKKLLRQLDAARKLLIAAEDGRGEMRRQRDEALAVIEDNPDHAELDAASFALHAANARVGELAAEVEQLHGVVAAGDVALGEAVLAEKALRVDLTEAQAEAKRYLTALNRTRAERDVALDEAAPEEALRDIEAAVERVAMTVPCAFDSVLLSWDGEEWCAGLRGGGGPFELDRRPVRALDALAALDHFVPEGPEDEEQVAIEQWCDEYLISHPAVREYEKRVRKALCHASEQPTGFHASVILRGAEDRWIATRKDLPKMRKGESILGAAQSLAYYAMTGDAPEAPSVEERAETHRVLMDAAQVRLSGSAATPEKAAKLIKRIRATLGECMDADETGDLKVIGKASHVCRLMLADVGAYLTAQAAPKEADPCAE